MKKQKPYWEMTTAELAEATRQFDDPTYHPPAVKQDAAHAAQLRRWKQKVKRGQAQMTIVLDRKLVQKTDDYAQSQGKSVSEVIAEALKKHVKRKSA